MPLITHFCKTTVGQVIFYIVSVLEMKSKRPKIAIDSDSEPEHSPEVPEKPKAAVRGRTRKTGVEVDKNEKVI